jgi:diguanylate cyclase (GGDEF)-like protein
MSQVIDFKSGPSGKFYDKTKLPFLGAHIGKLTTGFSSDQWRALSRILDFATNAEKTIRRQEKRIDELEELSTLDDLTGLYNRRFLKMQVKAARARARRTGELNLLVYLDLNNFKSVNDQYGHEAGDEILKHMANILKNEIRDTDYAFRIGGDEFALIFTGSTLSGGIQKTKDILKTLERSPFSYQRQSLYISAAFGTASINHHQDSGQILRTADLAMYKNKRGAIYKNKREKSKKTIPITIGR